MISKKRFSVGLFFFIIFNLIIIRSLTAAILAPTAQPFFVVPTKSTTITITAYIPDANLIRNSVTLLRMDANGKVLANLGTLNDDGILGDSQAGDLLFTKQIEILESQTTLINLRITAALKGVLKRITSDMNIQVTSVPEIYDTLSYAQTITSIYDRLQHLQQLHMCASCDEIQIKTCIDEAVSELLVLYSGMESIYRAETHSPSDYPKWEEYAPILGNLVEKSNEVSTEMQIFAVNGSDPRVKEIAQWCIEQGILDNYQLITASDKIDRELCAQQYMVHNNNSKFHKEVLPEAGHIAVTQETGQFTNLIGQGLGDLFNLGSLTVKGINYGISKLIDIFSIEDTGETGLAVMAVQDGQTVEIPTGEHDILFSFGENIERGIVRNIPISSALSPFVEVSPKDTKSYGLVAYYPFNGNADDESGNGNNGTVHGATLTSDRFGNPNGAYYFNGIDGFIDASPINISTADSFTVSFWMKFELQPNRTWLMYFNSNGASSGFHALLNTDQWGFHDTQFGLFNDANAQNNFVLNPYQNQWVHVTTVYDASKCSLVSYVNGVAVNSKTPCYFPFLSTGRLYLGQPNGGWAGDSYFKGSLDEIRIYNRALSDLEIQQLGGSNLNAALVAYYPFNSNANDASGNGHHGTVYGSPFFENGIMGTALHFNSLSNDDYVQINGLSIDSKPITLVAWVHPDYRDDISDGYMFYESLYPNNVISGDIPGHGGYGFGLNYRSDVGKVELQSETHSEPGHHLLELLNYDPEVYYFICMVYDVNEVRAYRGSSLGSPLTLVSVLPNDAVLDGNKDYILIGRHNFDAGWGIKNPFRGSINQVRIYNRVLSDSEINLLYNK